MTGVTVAPAGPHSDPQCGCQVASLGASLYYWMELKTNEQLSVKNNLSLYFPKVFLFHQYIQHYCSAYKTLFPPPKTHFLNFLDV